MDVSIYIENERVDMFTEEGIGITSSVLDIQNIDINTTEYSNTFTLPATPTNNLIFKHYYNSDILNGFDARTAVTARIEVSGVVYRTGKIVLLKVSMNSGSPFSYSVNFFGELLSLKKLIGKDKLSSLDTSYFDEPYNPDFIKALLTNTQTPNEISESIAHREELQCSLFANKRYFYQSAAVSYDTELETNIRYNASETDNGVLWSELIPSVKLSYIIERIEAKYGIVFSRSFLGLDPFNSLFMLLDNESGNPEGTREQGFGFAVAVGQYSYILPSGIYLTPISGRTFTVIVEANPLADYKDVPFIFRVKNNNVTIWQESTVGRGYFEMDFPDDGNIYDLSFTVESESYIKITNQASVNRKVNNVSEFYEDFIGTVIITMSSVYKLNEQMPDIGIMDFLKGIIQAYKLVIIAQQDGTIYLDTVKKFYDAGGIKDITKYIDISKHNVSRGTIINDIKYKFQEPNTILNKEFKGTSETGYGDEQFSILDDDGELIEGQLESVILPFEQIIYERLRDVVDGIATNVCYAALIDEKLSPKHVKPHLHYSILTTIGLKTIGYKRNTSTVEDLGTQYFRPSHRITDVSSGDVLLFSEEIDEYTGLVMSDTLYQEYHQEYIESLFNKKRRSYQYTAKNMSIYLINSIGLNDTLIIKNNPYRIDKFSANIVTGEVKFNLYNLLSDG